MSYSRRISMPPYRSLNSFMFTIDDYTMGAGNPNLKPSYSDMIEVTHTFFQSSTLTLGYTNTKDMRNSMQTFDLTNGKTVYYPGNFGREEIWCASLNAPMPVGKKRIKLIS